MTVLDSPGQSLPAGSDQAQLQRLLDLRADLLAERAAAASPAVARALQLADQALFLALTYYGYSDLLFPEHEDNDTWRVQP